MKGGRGWRKADGGVSERPERLLRERMRSEEGRAKRKIREKKFKT